MRMIFPYSLLRASKFRGPSLQRPLELIWHHIGFRISGSGFGASWGLGLDGRNHSL